MEGGVTDVPEITHPRTDMTHPRTFSHGIQGNCASASADAHQHERSRVRISRVSWCAACARTLRIGKVCSHGVVLLGRVGAHKKKAEKNVLTGGSPRPRGWCQHRHLTQILKISALVHVLYKSHYHFTKYCSYMQVTTHDTCDNYWRRIKV